MDYTLLDWLLSLAPLLAVLGLMVARGWSGSRAGAVGWLLALALAALRFGAGADVLAYAQIKAAILTVDVSVIVWAALLLYYVVDRAGALQVITGALANLTADRLTQALLLGWVFASLLQGMGGFGVPVAIVAPLLVGMGLPAVRAVVIPAIGHGWAVTFGSLAASFVMLVNVSGLPGDRLAPPAALMLGAFAYICGLMAAHAFDGWRGARRAIPYVLVTGTTMSLAQYVLVTNGLWTLGAIGAGLAGLAVSVAWVRFAGRPARPAPAALEAPAAHRPLPSVRLALAGYGVLIALALALRAITPVQDFLGQWALAVDIPATTTGRGWHHAAEEGAGFAIPGHPGLIILYSSLIAYVLYRLRGLYLPGAARDILGQSGSRALKSGVAVFMMVAIAATMERAGMVEVVARGLSDTIPGGLYAFVAPLIGAIGAFVTGSNVNSNAVFGGLHRETAALLGLSALTILASQTTAAAVISVMSPAKVTVGCSTVGAPEGQVLRWLLGYGAVVVLLAGALTWLALHAL
jgi:lactate permease